MRLLNIILADIAYAAETTPDIGGVDTEKLDPMILLVIAAALMVVTIVLAVCLILSKRREMSAASGAVSATAREIKGVSIGKLHEQGAREYQQDCFAVSDTALMSDRGILAVIADGMGGLSDGDKVSKTIVEAVLDGFMELPGQATHEQELLALTGRAMTAVDRLLGPNGYQRSGSTLIMGLFRGRGFSFVSVGDSRICLFRDGELMQLNREHIYKNELILRAVNGEQTLGSVYSDKKGSGLTSFVGMGKLKHIDMPASPITVRPGDKLVLMSDGIYNAMSTSELTDALSAPAQDAADAIRSIITQKNYQNQDNYTGVIIECLAEAQAPVSKPLANEQAAVPNTLEPEN